MRSGRLAIIVAAVLLSLIARLNWVGGPFSRDESAAMTVAREMQFGELPNVTAWQQRHPGTYLFYFAASLVPVGADAQLDLLAATAVAVTVIALGSWLFATVSPLAAAFGVLAYAIVSADLATQGQTANTELIINALLTSAVALLARFRNGRAGLAAVVAAGVLVGISGSIKEHTVLFCLVMAFVLLRPRGGPRSFAPAGAFVVGAALPWLAIVGVYALAGEMDVVIDTFLFNAYHVTLPLKDLLAGPLLLFTPGLGPLWGTWPLWLLALMWAGVRASGRGFSTYGVSYLAAAAGMIVLPGYYFAHYYLLALPAVAACGAAFVHAVEEQSRKRAAILAAAVVAFVALMQVAFATGHVPLEVRKLAVTDEGTVAQRAFARALGEKCQGATLLLYGTDHQFHLYSALRPAQPILWLSYYDATRFRGADAGAKPFLDRALNTLASRAPDLVLLQTEVRLDDDRPVARRLATLLREGYETVPVVSVAGNTRVSLDQLRAESLFRRRGGDECGRPDRHQ